MNGSLFLPRVGEHVHRYGAVLPICAGDPRATSRAAPVTGLPSFSTSDLQAQSSEDLSKEAGVLWHSVVPITPSKVSGDGWYRPPLK